MNKVIKFIINVFIFMIVAAFVVYIIKSIFNNSITLTDKEPDNIFVSNYTKAREIDIKDTISAFDVVDQKLFVLVKQKVLICDFNGQYVSSIVTEADVMDLFAEKEKVYLLYPTYIEIYLLNGDLWHRIEACSDLSDYCSFTITHGFIFVTDAENKNICEYTTDGNFVRFIQSPRGFVTPSHAFDITSFNDTIYCVNPGRHLIETYTLNGEFIAAFGGPGSEPGFFSGCCNPVYISIDNRGSIYTSEKGIPRICRYQNKGTFQEMVLNHRLLGAGNKAHPIKAVDQSLWVANNTKIDIYVNTK